MAQPDKHGGLGHKVHHRDVVRVALHRLESQLEPDPAEEILDELRHENS